MVKEFFGGPNRRRALSTEPAMVSPLRAATVIRSEDCWEPGGVKNWDPKDSDESDELCLDSRWKAHRECASHLGETSSVSPKPELMQQR